MSTRNQETLLNETTNQIVHRVAADATAFPANPPVNTLAIKRPWLGVEVSSLLAQTLLCFPVLLLHIRGCNNKPIIYNKATTTTAT